MASKTKKKTPAARKSQNSRWVLLFALILCIFLCAFAFFRLGILGSILFGFFALFFGYTTYFVLIGIIAACIFTLFFPRKKIRGSWIAAAVLIELFLMLVISLTAPDRAFLLDRLNNSFFNVLSGSMTVAAGYLGTLSEMALTALISTIGAWIVTLICLIAAVVILLWPYRGTLLTSAEKFNEQKKEKRRQKAQENELKKIERERLAQEDEPEFVEQKSFNLDDLIVELEPEEIEETEQDIKPVFAPRMNPDYHLPSSGILNEPKKSRSSQNQQSARENGQKLIAVLDQFHVPARLSDIHIGPSVTQFELSLDPGIRVNTITNLQNEIKMALAATDIRVEAPIPGKSAIGIEVPNAMKIPVTMKEMMEDVPSKPGSLTFCLGKDLYGNNIYGHLEKMPHLLIAGATGSGKSVCVNAIISSLLLQNSPEEVRLVLIDPKKVEFAPYNDILHLLTPVITDAAQANQALKVIVTMMDERYNLFEEYKVRNIEAYNQLAAKDEHIPALPRIVVIIDELADLMLVASKEVEHSIQRITQLARAAGIHLIVATQRPSVNVITGVIKANIPSRIAFAVSSAVDSRTILDQAGAERLLGYGDMLFIDNGQSAAKRIQGAFIQDNEVFAICEEIKEQGSPQYETAFEIEETDEETGPQIHIRDPLYDPVREYVIESRKASTSLIQRRFSIGYARAARIMDALEKNGVIGPARGSRPREILQENV